METLELQKNQLPYNTGVVMNGFNNQEIYIIKETEKAFLLCYTKIVRRGTSMVNDHVEKTLWCPKSVWFNEDNFSNVGPSQDPTMPVVFNAPYFITK